MANDASGITLTGSGTFGAGSNGQQDFTGAGTWQTFDSSGASTGRGTYQVTAFVSFVEAPGTQQPVIDTIGNIGDDRAGLVVLQMNYSDGSNGILVVSCHLPGAGPPTTPPGVFEGITASKGFIDYWNRVPPSPGVDANRTLFHVLH